MLIITHLILLENRQSVRRYFWRRLDGDIEMENRPSAEAYHADERPDSIKSPSSVPRGNKACRLWRIGTIGVNFCILRMVLESSGGHVDFARGSVYKKQSAVGAAKSSPVSTSPSLLQVNMVSFAPNSLILIS